jgi:hypothetical protein
MSWQEQSFEGGVATGRHVSVSKTYENIKTRKLVFKDEIKYVTKLM